MIYRGLLLFFVLEYVRPSIYLPVLDALKIPTLVPIGLAFAAIVTKGKVTNAAVLADPATKLVAVFLGLLGLSLVTATVTFYAFETLKAVFGYLLVFWVIAKRVDDTDKVFGVFRTLVVVHLALAALNPQLLTNPEVRSYLVSAPFLGDGNDFALSVNLVISLCYCLVMTAPTKKSRLLHAIALLVLVACVIATQSRGATVALACLAVYYWLKTKRKLVTTAVISGAVVLVFVFAPSAYFDRMHTINTTESSAQGRIDSWKAAWSEGLQNPVLGAGAGHYSVAVNRLTAHSVYFLALGELGFPGLSVLILLILANLATNRRLIARVRTSRVQTQQADMELVTALSASVIAFAVNGAFLSALYYPHLYILAGLSVAGRRVVRERLAEGGVGGVADVALRRSAREDCVLQPVRFRERVPAAYENDWTAPGRRPSRSPE